MIFKSDTVAAQWDTWCYHHDGTYYLYYLVTEHTGEGFGVATSKDGVHWKDHGWAVRQSEKNTYYLGTGSVWKSPDFEKTGKFICNYSEHRKDETGRRTQNILFAWSTDLIRWHKFGDEKMFKVDTEHYKKYGRWDCIFTMPRAEGGYWGTWTATGVQISGTVGIGYSEDGLNWKALPPPVVEPGVWESGAFYRFGNRIHAMFGAGGMWAYSADKVAGPYARAKTNALLLTKGHTYFCRFFPTPDGVLVNHHSMTGEKHTGRLIRDDTYVAPLKRAAIDKEGILRFKYWQGNEVLKGEVVEVAARPSPGLVTMTGSLDFGKGIVVEGTVRLPKSTEDEPVGVNVEPDDGCYVVRMLDGGSVELGTVDKSGGNWQKRHQANRQWDFGEEVSLRLLLRRGMMEVYLDNHFMECWTMGCPNAKTATIAVVGQADDLPVGELKVWQMTLAGYGAATEKPVPVGLQKQLLVDDFVIAEKQNVTRELGQVKKVGVVIEPSLDTDFHPTWKKPDGSRVALDFGYYLSVVRNERDKKFQMWYMAYRSSGVGYCESTDGIHWTKPLVGKDGKSNIVHRCQGFSCTLDPTLPWGHAEKYRGAGDFQDSNSRVAICHSPDGIHWSDYNEGKPVSHRAADTHNQLFWDPISKTHRLVTRTDLGGQGGASESRSTRIMTHTARGDVMQHPTMWKTVADKICVDDPLKEKTPWGTPRLQFNGMTVWIYEGIYFGLMDVYTMGKARFFDGFDYQTRHDDDYMDFYIGTSRDGMNFDRSWIYARKPFVPRGKAGSFDKDGIKPPAEIVTHNDEHWIFYGGMDERHYSRGRHLKIGLAKLRLDGFVCLRAEDKLGTVVTKPFVLDGGRLEVNVDCGKTGRIQVEMLDASGKAIPGFSGKNAGEYSAVDDVRFTPAWKNREDLSTLDDKVVRIRFRLQNAKLYSFKINK